MNKVIFIENKCIVTIHAYIELLLNKNKYTQNYSKWPVLDENFENIKPFLKNINKKLYDDREKLLNKISLDDMVKDYNNIQYIFYIIKGYQLTVARYHSSIDPHSEHESRNKQPESQEINAIIVKFLKVVDRYKRNARLKRNFVKRAYLDNFTKKKFYKNITNYIISYM